MLMKLLILLVFVAILASLGSGLYHLLKGGDSKKMANALTLRIALSVALFAALFAAWALGLLQPHSLG
jgi:undecaprenyl pyrophosphate phosphatase UppP